MKNTSTKPRTARHARPWLAIALLALLPVAFAQDMDMGGMEPDEHDGEAQQRPEQPMDMAPGVNVPRFPPVPAFAEGGTLFFIHSETSDPEVSETLSLMMGSPVVTVPALGEAPPEALADLYVFTNGVQGGTDHVPMMGPFGFQPDVFDGVPGEEGYTPLRRLNLVTWNDPSQARVLRSADQARSALESDEITVEQPGVVINAPVLMWPLGRR